MENHRQRFCGRCPLPPRTTTTQTSHYTAPRHRPLQLKPPSSCLGSSSETCSCAVLAFLLGLTTSLLLSSWAGRPSSLDGLPHTARLDLDNTSNGHLTRQKKPSPSGDIRLGLGQALIVRYRSQLSHRHLPAPPLPCPHTALFANYGTPTPGCPSSYPSKRWGDARLSTRFRPSWRMGARRCRSSSSRRKRRRAWGISWPALRLWS